MYGLSQTVEEAIRNYLIQNNVSKNKSGIVKATKETPPRIWQLKRNLRSNLSKKYQISEEELEEAKLKDVKDAIGLIRGTDKRTVKSNYDALIRYDCIKLLENGNVWVV